MFNISEIFYSISGESRYSGYPFVFLRLAGCNLKCKWCDTKYSSKIENQYTVAKIMEIIQSYKINKILITGGEPLLQKDICHLFNVLLKYNYLIMLETNGSVSIKNIPKEIHIVLDHKLPSSKMDGKMLIENFNYIKKSDEIKFVILNKFDFLKAVDIIDKYDLIKKTHIVFSPVNLKLSPQKLSEWILNNKLNVRLQLQLHKILWPDIEKGV